MEGKIKTKGRRLLVMFAVLLAVTALMCVSAFAEGVAKVVKADSTETVYASLDTAISEAETGSTVHVLANTTLNGCAIDKTLTIDGENFEVTVKNPDNVDDGGDTNTIQITANGDVTLKNITIKRTDKNASFAVLRVTGGKLTLGSGTTISKVSGGAGSAIYVDDGGRPGVGEINMEAGSLIDSCYRGAQGSDSLWSGWNYPSILLQGGTFNMNGGTIKGGKAVTSGMPSAIYLEKANVVVNLNGGTITGNSGGVGAIGVNAGTLNVSAAANVTDNGGININKMAETAKISLDDGIVTGNLNAGDTIWLDDKAEYVAVARTGVYYDVPSAINSVKDGSTVYLLKDAEYAGNLEINVNQNLVFDGQGHTLKMVGQKVGSNQPVLKFINVTMDISGAPNNEGAFLFWDGTITFGNGCTVVGKEYTEEANPGGYLLQLCGGTANIEEGCVIRDNKRYVGAGIKAGAIYVGQQWGNNPVLNMTGGKITGCSAMEGGAIYFGTNNTGNGTFNMTGGEISGNYSWSGSGVRAVAGVKLNISGDAKVYDNIFGTMKLKKASENIRANDAALNINGAFTGKIGFVFDGCDRDKNVPGRNIPGTKIGTIDSDLTLASVDSIVCDWDNTLIAYASNGELKLTKKLTLTPEISMGKYIAADSKTYGVVRVNTYVNGIEETTAFESVGTYFCKSADGVKLTTNLVEITSEKLTNVADGNGYMADVYHINEDTATVYAVSFYKLQGMDGYVFSVLEPISYNAKDVKFVDYTE